MGYQSVRWEDTTFTNSFMFRLVMEKQGLCQKLIERLLNIKITRMELPTVEKDMRVSGEGRGIRLDVYVEDADGIAYDIEMQTVAEDKAALGKRARYYQSMMDMGLLKKSMSFSRLRRSYIIFICTFDPFEAGLAKYTFVNQCVEKSSVALDDGAIKLFFNAEGDRHGLSVELQNLLDYVRGDVVTGDDFIIELQAEVDMLHLDDRKRAMYMTFEQEMLYLAEKSKQDGMIEVLASLVKDNLISITEAAKRCGMLETDFRTAMAKFAV